MKTITTPSGNTYVEFSPGNWRDTASGDEVYIGENMLYGAEDMVLEKRTNQYTIPVEGAIPGVDEYVIPTDLAEHMISCGDLVKVFEDEDEISYGVSETLSKRIQEIYGPPSSLGRGEIQ